MNEIGRAQKWIYDKLSVDPDIVGAVALRIYANQAPEGAPFPLILFTYQGGFDTRGNGTCRIQTNPVFQIKVVCEGSPDDAARLVADRIDALFQEAVTEISESYVFSSRRDQPIQYAEPVPDSAQILTHVGGLYRLVIYPEA